MRPEDVPVDQRPRDTQAWAYLLETWHTSAFIVSLDDGVYVATFADDGAVIPIRSMRYNQELGLYGE